MEVISDALYETYLFQTKTLQTNLIPRSVLLNRIKNHIQRQIYQNDQDMFNVIFVIVTL